MCTPGDFSVNIISGGCGLEGDTDFVTEDDTVGVKIVSNSGDKSIGVRTQSA